MKARSFGNGVLNFITLINLTKFGSQLEFFLYMFLCLELEIQLLPTILISTFLGMLAGYGGGGVIEFVAAERAYFINSDVEIYVIEN